MFKWVYFRKLKPSPIIHPLCEPWICKYSGVWRFYLYACRINIFYLDFIFANTLFYGGFLNYTISGAGYGSLRLGRTTKGLLWYINWETVRLLMDIARVGGFIFLLK